MAGLVLCSSIHVLAQFTYSENFKNDTAAGWSFYQGSSGPGARLTSGATGVAGADPEGATTLDPSGSGWLRVATATTQQANAVFFDTPIPSAGNEVKISFNVNMWGGNNLNNTGADGLTFFLYDASVPFQVGAFGGSLGYAQKDAAQGADTTHDGMAGGFLGVALDAYGNFSRAAEGRDGGTSALSPNSVVLRGPGSGQTGYDYLAGTSGSNGTVGTDYTDTGGATTNDTGDGVLAALPYTMAFKDAAARPDQSTQYRKVEFTLTEASQLIIRMQFGEDGLWYEVMNADVSSFARPEQLRFGFSAGTGSGTQVYEVGGMLQITATAGSGSFLWDRGDGTNLWGTGATDSINWYGNTNPTAKSNVVFNSAYITGAQTVDLRDTDKTVKNLYFSGSNAYNLATTEGRKLIFDSDTVGGLTTISLTSDVGGNAAHTIGVDVLMNKTLDINNTIATHSFTLSGNVDTNGNALNFKGNGTTVASGVISGAGAITKSDTGTTVLSGASANTYTGATTINGGTLQIEKAGALGSTAAGTTVNSGGTLALNGTGLSVAEGLTLNGTGSAGQGALYNATGANTLTGTVALAGDTTVGAAGGSTLTVSGVVSGAGGNDLTKSGAGTLVLSGTNTYTGATNITAGTLVVSNENNIGANPGAFNAAQLNLDGGTLRTQTSTVTINDTNRGVTVGAAGGTFETASDLVIANAVAGTGTLTKTGAGTLTLSGPNTHSGAIAINTGTLAASGGSAIGDTAAVTIAAGATFSTAGSSETVGSIAGAGGISLGSGATALTVGGNNASTVYSGVITGSATADLVKAGSGTLTMSGANTFTGNLQVNSGTVALGASNVFNNATSLVLNGGTFASYSGGTGFSDTFNDLSLLASSNLDFGSLAGVLTFGAASRTAGTLTIYGWAGDISGGGASQVIFSSGPTGFTGSLDQITFDGYGAGATRLGSGEIVPLTGTVFTWNATGTTWANSANWDSTPDGSPNGTGHTAIFGNAITSNLTLSLGNNRTLGYLVFNDDNNVTLQNNNLRFNVSAGAAQLNVNNTGSVTISSAVGLNDALSINQNSTGTLTLSGTISNQSGNNTITVGGAGNTTISGQINTGTGGLTKTGTGTLTLTGTNVYTGKTIINGGVLAIDNESRLGSNPGASVADQLTLDGGTLRTQTAAVTINDANRKIFIGSAGGTFDTVTNLTVASTNVLSGTGTVTKTGAGTLNLSAVNTHTGDFVVNAGTLATSGGAAIGDAATVTINGGSSVWQTGNAETVGNIAGDGQIVFSGSNTLTVGSAANSTFTGTIVDNANTGILTKAGTGTLTLGGAGANAYDGATNITAGTLNIQKATALGSTTGGTVVSDNAALELQHGTGLAIGAEALTLAGTGANSSNNGALRSVAGANSLSGNITLAGTTEIQTEAGSSLTLSGGIASASSQNLVIDGAGNTTLSGVLAASVGTLEKNGTGTLTLANANLYTGATTLAAGTVIVSNASGLGTTGAATTVANNASLALTSGGSMTVAENLTLQGQGVGSAGALQNLAGTNTLSGTIALAGESHVGVAAATQLTASGVISGGYGLTKLGDGTLTLSGANTYTGTTAVTAGTLVAQTSSALGTNANPTTVASGATLALNGTFATTESVTLAGAGVASAGALQSTAGTNSLSGSVNLVADSTIGVTTGAALTASGVVSGTGFNLTKAGDGTLTLTGANTYTGTTAVTAGVLNIQNSSALGTAAAGTTVTAGAALQVQNNISIGAETLALSGSGITNTGALRNISGDNSLAGAVTLTGATEIQSDAGSLTLTGGITGTNQNLTIDGAGATTLAGAITTGSGTLIKSGAGNLVLSGTNTFTGATTLGGTGTVTLAGAGGGALGGTSGVTLASGSTTLLGASDQINDAANLTLSGGTLRLNGFQDVLNNVTLTASTTSAVDYLNENSLLRFAGTATAGTGSQLTIDNWAGNPNTGGSTSYGLLFNSLAQAQILENSVLFSGWSTLGNNSVILNSNGYYEIVPIVTIKEWNITGGGAWDTTGNWNPGGEPDGTSAIALFGNSITAGTTAIINNSTVSTDIDTVSKLMITSTGNRNYSITGNASEFLEFNASTGSAQLIVSGDGSHTIGNILRASSKLVITNDGTATTPLTISAAVDLRNGASSDLTVGGSGRTVVTGVISGNTPGASLLKTGDGTLSLEAANSYTGTTTIRNGTLEIAGDAPSGVNGNLGNATSAVVLNDSGTAAGNNTALLMTDANGGSTLGRAITVGSQGATTTLGGTNTSGTNTFSGNIALGKEADLTAAAGGTVAFTGVLSGAGGIEKVGAGTVVLGGTTQNTFTGNVTVSAGTLQIAKTGAGVDALPASGNQGAIGDQAAVTVASGASLVFNGDANQVLEEIGSLAGGATASVNNLQATALTLYTGQNNTSTTYAGTLTDTGGNLSLVKQGTGTMTLSGANTYDGDTTVSAGTLLIAHSAALGNDTGNTSVSAGATLELQNTITVSAAETITLGSSAAAPTASLRNSAGSNTLAGDIALSGAASQGIRIDAATSTTLALSGAITESAGTFINKTGGGTLALSGTTANTFSGGLNLKDGTVTFNKSGAGLNTAAGTGTLTIGDGIGLAATATGSLLASNQLNDSAAVVLGSDGRLNLNNNSDTVGSIAGSGQIIMGTGQLIAGGNNSSTTFSGTLVGGSAAILSKEGSGTLTIASNVNATPGDFAGTLSLNTGTLAFNVDNAFNTVNISAGTTLRLSDTTLTIASLNLTGNGSITLDFAGAASQLNVTNLTIAAGITLNIINWQDAVDYFFAANWNGAVIDTTGSAPMNQVIFNSPTWSGSDTKWQGYDDQITPVPEPSTYGAMLLGAMGALLGYRRWRRAKAAKA